MACLEQEAKVRKKRTPCSIRLGEVSALDHEVLDHSVEHAAFCSQTPWKENKQITILKQVNESVVNVMQRYQNCLFYTFLMLQRSMVCVKL